MDAKVGLFGVNIPLKQYSCSLDGKPARKYSEKFLNLYVELNNNCNANCKFCINTDTTNCKFDFNKFKEVITEITSKVFLNKVSFTGGEPTLDIKLLGKLAKYIREVSPNTFIVVNTNGSNLNRMTECAKYFDSISLSRHHYEDSINNSLFSLNSCSAKELADCKFRDRIHLSCNLIKGCIDSAEQVKKYLDFADKVGIRDVGFVTLMQANKYCKDKFIDFNSIDISNVEGLFVSKNWQIPGCRCRNYVYSAPSGNIVKAYARYYIDRQVNNPSGILVFEDNNLKFNFGNKIIY